MLQIGRRPGERVVIGHGKRQVTVEVTFMRRGYVRLGIEAPADMPVDREEIRRAKIVDGTLQETPDAG